MHSSMLLKKGIGAGEEVNCLSPFFCSWGKEGETLGGENHHFFFLFPFAGEGCQKIGEGEEKGTFNLSKPRD